MSQSRIKELRKLLELDPDDALGHFMLGREYLKENLFEEAIPAFRRVLEINPDYTAAWRQLGAAYEKAGDRQEAVQAYLQGIEVARRTRDLQSGKECAAFLRRLGETPPSLD